MSSLFKKKPKPPKPPKPVKSTTKPPELPRPRKPSNQVSDDDEHEYLQPDDWITPSPSKVSLSAHVFMDAILPNSSKTTLIIVWSLRILSLSR